MPVVSRNQARGTAAALGEAYGGPLAGAVAGWAASEVYDAATGGTGGYSGADGRELVALWRAGKLSRQSLEYFANAFETNARAPFAYAPEWQLEQARYIRAALAAKGINKVNRPTLDLPLWLLPPNERRIRERKAADVLKAAGALLDGVDEGHYHAIATIERMMGSTSLGHVVAIRILNIALNMPSDAWHYV